MYQFIWKNIFLFYDNTIWIQKKDTNQNHKDYNQYNLIFRTKKSIKFVCSIFRTNRNLYIKNPGTSLNWKQ